MQLVPLQMACVVLPLWAIRRWGRYRLDFGRPTWEGHWSTRDLLVLVALSSLVAVSIRYLLVGIEGESIRLAAVVRNASWVVGMATLALPIAIYLLFQNRFRVGFGELLVLLWFLLVGGVISMATGFPSPAYPLILFESIAMTLILGATGMRLIGVRWVRCRRDPEGSMGRPRAG